MTFLPCTKQLSTQPTCHAASSLNEQTQCRHARQVCSTAPCPSSLDKALVQATRHLKLPGRSQRSSRTSMQAHLLD